MSFEGERDHYRLSAEKHRRKGELETNVAEKNAVSIDGLPAFGGDRVGSTELGD